MKTAWKFEAPQLAILALMLIWAAASWSSAPASMPVHWGVDGTADRYGGRFEGVALIPLIGIALYLLLRFIPAIDPGRANYDSFVSPYAILRLSLMVFLAALYVVTQLQAYGREVPMDRVMGLLVGGLFIALGGVIGKVRPNWFVGVRTPWTLSSKESWVKTHRLAGRLFVATGAAAVIAGGLLRGTWTMGVVLGGAIGSAVVSAIYSWWVWKQDPEKLPPAGTLPAP